MTVNTDPSDKTWLTHLDGFLAILQQQQPSSDSPFMDLQRALHIVEHSTTTNVEYSLTSSTTEDAPSAPILLNISTLHLRRLATTLQTLPRNTKSPRKLDLQKIQTELKRIYKDLGCIPTLFNAATSTMQWLHYHTIRLIAASLLLDTAVLLYTKRTCPASKEHGKLTQTIAEAGAAVYSTALGMFPPDDNYNGNYIDSKDDNDTTSPPHAADSLTWKALSLTFPLTAALIAHGSAETQKQRVREVLWCVGQRAKVPKAMSLVSDGFLCGRCVWLSGWDANVVGVQAESEKGDVGYVEVLGGMVVVGALGWGGG